MEDVQITDITNAKKSYSSRNEGPFPQEMTINLKKADGGDKKYGENPQQQCAVYDLNEINGKDVRSLSQFMNLRYVRTDDKGKGGLSLNNEMDITRAIDVLKFFRNNPAVVIMKHVIASGFARQTSKYESMPELFRRARDADRQSNFGGTAVFTRLLDMETAKAMYELRGQSPFFVDVVAAPGYDEGVVSYLESQSKNLRISEFGGLDKIPRFIGDETYGLVSIKELPGGKLGVQDVYLTSIKGPEDLILRPGVKDKEGNMHAINTVPTENEINDLLTAWYLNIAGARSNGVVFVKNGASVAIGSGQVERFGAVAQAITKGFQKRMDIECIEYNPLEGINGYEQLTENPFNGAVCASDAFFPFPDCIEKLIAPKPVGVKAVIQPYGSINDAAVIDAANRYNVAMPATLERCFGHW